ncbi:hypothetical protein FKM82_019158 [Ascaphus truei]|uniref:olfactory receptor 6F1-like n=1 Tax=Ascaphus truei TaxID=8439 RepID=UPI003F5AB662
MKENNGTAVMEFILLGFSISNEIGFLLFIIISIVYILTIATNVIIVAIVNIEQRLHKPMYLFIGVFSFLEIWYPSVTVPRLLWALLTKRESISPVGCMTQFYFHFSLGATESFLLVAMAYDRYVAICNPLRYLTIMSHKSCTILLLGSWSWGFIIVVVPCLQISNLSFCGPNQMDHYYCDFAPLLKLSCSKTSNIETLVFVSSCFVILGCFLLIIVSYTYILSATMKFPTSQGRGRAFSTCASHLTVVLIFYGTTMFMFLRPTTGDSMQMNKIISIFPSIVTPLLNPIIYTLRNKDVKKALKKTMHKMMKCRVERNLVINF